MNPITAAPVPNSVSDSNLDVRSPVRVFDANVGARPDVRILVRWSGPSGANITTGSKFCELTELLLCNHRRRTFIERSIDGCEFVINGCTTHSDSVELISMTAEQSATPIIRVTVPMAIIG